MITRWGCNWVTIHESCPLGGHAVQGLVGNVTVHNAQFQCFTLLFNQKPQNKFIPIDQVKEFVVIKQHPKLY